VIDQIIVAWMRQKKLTDGEHLLNGYFDLKAGSDSSVRSPFADRSYVKLMGDFARLARDNPSAKLFVLRLDQEPTSVAMQLDDAMAKMLREDPVLYIRTTSPPPRGVKLKLDDRVKPNKIQGNIEDATQPHREAWGPAPIPGGYDTVVESFGDDIYCRMSGNLIECPSCGRWAATKLVDDHGGGVDMECASCLFRDIFTITASSNRRWAAIPTEALLQNSTANGVRFFIPRAWNKGGPWIKTEELKQKYETFCVERNNASRND
jgi:hypothetical protein